jgi:hypothetical protein
MLVGIFKTASLLLLLLEDAGWSMRWQPYTPAKPPLPHGIGPTPLR